MKILASAKITKGWDHWKSVFESDRHKQIRSDAGVNVVGYGYHPDTGRAYVVQEVGSMETMQIVYLHLKENKKYSVWLRFVGCFPEIKSSGGNK